MELCRFCRGPRHPGACDYEAVKNRIGALEEELRIARALDAARQKIDLPGVIMIRSLISHRNQKPRVDIQVGEIHMQMDADAAMDVAHGLIVSSMGAYADSFMWHFLKEKIEIDDGRALQVLEEFRDFREKLKEEFDELQKEKPE